jgi:sodium-dependent dicarboxylate transporter 2/3/5
MLATAFMSMWISNTATSIMMLPIATSVLGILPEKSREALNKPILLSVAWAANIGGMATIIGTPPNMIFAGFMSEQLGRPIGFVEWLPVGLSAALLLGLTAFLILGRRLDQGTLTLEEREETEHWLAKEWDRLGSLDPAQKRVAFIFAGTSLLWIVRPYLAQWTPSIEWSDTAIALLAAMSLFSIQNGKGAPLVHWSDTRDLPWGILVLFGGGLALAGTLQESYWFDALGQSLTALSQLPVWMWLLVMAVLGVFATEMLSNMALVSALLPLTLSLSIALGIPMYELSLPLVLGASCAFMLPMATPPNAIVFSTGKLTMPYMMGRGLVLNVVSVVVLAALGWVIYGMG